MIISVQTGVYPPKLQHAKVIPVRQERNGTRQLLANFIPICVYRLFEILMSVETPHILYRRKAKSFLKKRLVSKQIVRLNTQFGILSTKYKAIWKQVCTRVVYPSISETAFDRVEHTVLLCKLSHCGKRGIINNWFDSYLNDSL